MSRQTIAVSALVEASGVRKGVDESNRHLGRLSKSARGLGRVLKTAVAGTVIAASLTAITTSGSDAQQSLGATEAVYGKYAKTVIARSKAASNAIGLSANEYRELSNVSGAMLKSTGTPLNKIAGLTDKLNTRAADLAATYGGTTKEAVEAVGSLLRGEADPIERYGVSIKQSDVNARLAAQGLGKLTGEARKQAEQQARLSLLFGQTKDAAGQFGRESATLAGQTQRGRAGLANLQATIGGALLPGLTTLASSFNTNLLPPLQKLADKYAPVIESKFQSLATDAGPKVTAVVDKLGQGLDSLGKGRNTDSLSSIGTSIGTLGTGLKDASASMPSFSDLLSVTSTILKFAADNTDLLAKAMPLLVAGLVAVKAAQAGANVVAIASLPTKVAEVVVNRQLVASNRALIASRAGLTTATVTNTAAENTGVLARARALASTVAQRVAMVASTAVTATATAAQWAFNVALSANPIGLIIAAVVALVAGLVLFFTKTKIGQQIWSVTWNGIKAVTTSVIGFLKPFVLAGFKAVATYIRVYVGIAKTVASVAWKGIQAVVRVGVNYVKTYVKGVMFVASIFRSAFNAARSAVVGGVSRIVGAARSVLGKIKGALSGAKTLLHNIGGFIVDGLRNGINAGVGKVLGAVDNLVSKIPKKIRKFLGIASPSKVTTRLGRFVAQGLELGINLGSAGIIRTIRRQGVNTKKEYAKQARDLKKQLLAAATNRVKALQAASKAYAADVRQNARDYAGLSSLQLGENENLNGGTIKQFLTDRLAQVQNFAAKLKQLAASGLSKDLYNQIVAMGVEQGSAYADALANETPETLKELNALQSQIGSATTTLGAETAKNMYAAGIDAARGFRNGLESYLKKITGSGKKIAKTLIRELKRALGIKSPSRVFAQLGRYTIDGLDKGLDAKRVERAGARVSTALQRGYTSREFDTKLAAGYGLAQANQNGARTIYIASLKLSVQVEAGMSEAEIGAKVWRSIQKAAELGMVKPS